MKILTREMLFRDLDLEARKATFVASTETAVETPWGPEVLRMKGARLARFRANPVVLDAHNRSRIADIIGRATVKVDRATRLLLVTIEYAPTKSGNEAWDLVSKGFLRAVSIGYAVNAERIRRLREDEVDGDGDAAIEGPALIVNEWELHEVSNVPIPADQHALRRSAFYEGALPSLEEAHVATKKKTAAASGAKRKGLEFSKFSKRAEEDSEAKKGEEDKAEDEDSEREEEDTCSKCGQAMPERAEDEDEDADAEREADESKDEKEEEEERALRRLKAKREAVLEIAPKALREFAEGLLLEHPGLTLEKARELLLAEHAQRAKPAGTPTRDNFNTPPKKAPVEPSVNLTTAELLSLPR